MDSIAYQQFKVNYLEILPASYPCPDCGQPAKRNSTGERMFQEADLDQPCFLVVRMSVCRCDNPACKRHYFRVPLPFAKPRSRYSERAKELCVAGVIRDGMPFSGVVQRSAEDFHLYPAKSTVWTWHGQVCDEIDLEQDYHPFVKASFSGVLSIDEVYDGPFCLLFSTDPLNGITVAYTLEALSLSLGR